MEPDFVCPECDRTFTSTAKLASHKKTHTRKKYQSNLKDPARKITDSTGNCNGSTTKGDNLKKRGQTKSLRSHVYDELFRDQRQDAGHVSDSCPKSTLNHVVGPADKCPKPTLSHVVGLKDLPQDNKKRDKTVNCQVCGASLSDRRQLKTHMGSCIQADNSITDRECADCGTAAQRSPSLGQSKTNISLQFIVKDKQTNLDIENGGELEKTISKTCEVCGKVFARSANVQLHMRLHRGEKPFTCSTCGKTFRRSDHLKNHELVHVKKGPYECSLCNETFKRKDHLKYHQINSHGAKIYLNELKSYTRTAQNEAQNKLILCDICGISFGTERNLKNHLRIHSNQGRFSCKYCGKAFNQSSNLNIHLRKHTGEAPYKCFNCDQSFTTSSKLKTHARKHTGDQPFTCEICGRLFGENHLLKMHMRIHCNQKSYKCSHCGKTFTHSSTLRAHVRIHTGAKPYKCDQCGDAFAQISSLTYHKRTHSGEKPYSCHICGNSYTRMATLNIHLTRHSGQKKLSCPHCDFKCDTPKHLRKHAAKTHGHLQDAVNLCLKQIHSRAPDALYADSFIHSPIHPRVSNPAEITDLCVTEAKPIDQTHGQTFQNSALSKNVPTVSKPGQLPVLSSCTDSPVTQHQVEKAALLMSSNITHGQLSASALNVYNPSSVQCVYGLIVGFSDMPKHMGTNIQTSDLSVTNKPHNMTALSVPSQPQNMTALSVPNQPHNMTALSVPCQPHNIPDLSVPSQPHNIPDLSVPSQPHNIPDLLVPSQPHNISDLSVPSQPHNMPDLSVPSKPQDMTDLSVPSQPHNMTDLSVPSKPQDMTDLSETSGFQNMPLLSSHLTKLDNSKLGFRCSQASSDSTGYCVTANSMPVRMISSSAQINIHTHKIINTLTQIINNSTQSINTNTQNINTNTQGITSYTGHAATSMPNSTYPEFVHYLTPKVNILSRPVLAESQQIQEMSPQTPQSELIETLQVVNVPESPTTAGSCTQPQLVPLDGMGCGEQREVLREKLSLEGIICDISDKSDSVTNGTEDYGTDRNKCEIHKVEDVEDDERSRTNIKKEPAACKSKSKRTILPRLKAPQVIQSKTIKSDPKRASNYSKSTENDKTIRKLSMTKPKSQAHSDRKSSHNLKDAAKHSRQQVKRKKRPVECDICGQTFSRTGNLTTHMRLHSGERPYSCKICEKTYTRSDHLKTHMLLHKGDHSLVCNHCGDVFSSTEQLNLHTTDRHEGKKPFACNLCLFSCVYLRELKEHIKGHEQKDSFKCDLCQVSFLKVKDLKKHMQSHDGQSAFACHTCEKSFKESSCLKLHMMTKHTGEKRFKCAICEETYVTAAKLQRHMRNHSGARPYACEFCGKLFIDTCLLKMHVRIHTNEKPFKCKHCGQSFTHRSTLRAHVRTHTGTKPYTCEVCGACFAQVSSLTYHKRRHDGVKPYTCHICANSYTRSTTLNIHMTRHTGQKRVSCPHCVFKCDMPKHLRKHLAKIHSFVGQVSGQGHETKQQVDKSDADLHQHEQRQQQTPTDNDHLEPHKQQQPQLHQLHAPQMLFLPQIQHHLQQGFIVTEPFQQPQCQDIIIYQPHGQSHPPLQQQPHPVVQQPLPLLPHQPVYKAAVDMSHYTVIAAGSTEFVPQKFILSPSTSVNHTY